MVFLGATSIATLQAGGDTRTPLLIGVVANIAPKQTQALCAYALKGDYMKAAALHLKLFPLIKSLFIETNPIPVKTALALMGLCRPEPRLPLTPLSSDNRPTLRKALKEFKLIK